MSVPTWPDIRNPDYSSSVGMSKPALRSKSESGYTIVRKGLGLGKDKRSLVWKDLPNADFIVLLVFFDANQGGSFLWTDPETFVTREYFFVDDELDFKYAYYGHKAGTVNIEEV